MAWACFAAAWRTVWTGQEEGTGYWHKCSGEAKRWGQGSSPCHRGMEGMGQSPVGRKRGHGEQEKSGWEGA